ncbi:sterol desaturase family protein [Rhodoferax sp.]|uniref:sterol desaturase family protein n=1 Tax=Rhodoferax sp. TaxID=50421 RepID=UPI00283AC165|nr:sterol desaturase family protein [Rhodoferax sp.]MDR3370883.1 sterol desaturase family protein [Rhodoferax sp.]
MKTIAIEHTRLAYYADFAIYLLAVLLLPGLLWHYSPMAVRAYLPLAGLAGLLMWTLIEYAMHRFVFHGMEPFQSLHAEHHRRPLALIATPTLVSVTLIAVLVWLPATLTGGFWLGSGAALGVTLGYFIYGVIHHGVHHWRVKNAWMRHCKRQHAIHHHNPRINYGVTMLWWDRTFGSIQKPIDNQN